MKRSVLTVLTLGVFFLSACSECEKCGECETASATGSAAEEVGGFSGELTVQSDGSRTLVYEGRTIRVDKSGGFEVVGADGSEVVVKSDGSISKSGRDIKVVTESTGKETVYNAESKNTVTYEEYVSTRSSQSSTTTNALIQNKTTTTTTTESKTTTESSSDDSEDSGKSKKDKEKKKKVTICHRPPGNPDNQHTLTIGESAVDAHLRNHPDHLGPCKDTPPSSGKGNKGKGNKGKGNKGHDDDDDDHGNKGKGNKGHGKGKKGK